MTSLEKSIDIVEKKGEDLMEKLLLNIDKFFNDCNEYLSIVKVLDYRNLKNYDNTKLILDISNLDISTSQFLDILAKDYSMEVEMTMGEYILLMTSINSEKKDFDELLRALMDIEKIYGVKKHKKENLIDYAFKLNQKVNPWTAFYMEKEDIKLKDSVGRISGSSIVPYPPGIPVISVGQEITKEVVSFIIKNRNSFNQIIGLKDEEIKVLKGC